jgi:hypothetical protein
LIPTFVPQQSAHYLKPHFPVTAFRLAVERQSIAVRLAVDWQSNASRSPVERQSNASRLLYDRFTTGFETVTE